MNNEQKHSGFSLTEILIAVGILAVGMTFIAGVFPAGIYLTTIATERTIAAVATDEAFAKIEIYAKDNPAGSINFGAGGVEPNHLKDFNDVLEPGVKIDPCEFAYPSDPGIDVSEKQYCWSALCRRAGPDPNRLVQVTVFVSRKVSPNLKYPAPPDGIGTVAWPMPVRVNVSGTAGNNELTITGEKTYINDGYTIVDDATGRIYRVLERYKPPNDSTILLDGRWEGGALGLVWVVPPPVIGTPPVPNGRYPCIAVYQKVIRF
jgi:prepilin-type N-terminal cleavage/methylation domain-containing protein